MAGDRLGTIRIGAAQAAPAFLDREASADRVVELIAEAGRQGVRLLGLPEGIIPAHPVWYHFQPVTSRESLAMAEELFANAVEVPGPTIDRVAEACAAHGVAAVLGVCEKRPDTTGTMYNSQVFIDRDGRLLGTHRKLMPTVGERIVHAGGSGASLVAHRTEAGPVTGLICGENSNALATHALADHNPYVHVASWPQHFSANEHPMREVVLMAGQSLAYRNNCFVVSACGVVSREMIDRMATTDEHRAFLEEPANGGGSCIIDPAGHVLAGPMPGDEEGVIAVDADLDACVRSKIVHDYAGHYNRPDVFTLRVSGAAPALVERDAPGVAVAEDEDQGEGPA